MKALYIILGLILLVVSCTPPTEIIIDDNFIDESVAQEPIVLLDNESLLVVDGTFKCYVGLPDPMNCFFINGKGSYLTIAGFRYEEGYNYTLKVVYEIDPRWSPDIADMDKYHYVLVDVVSKKLINDTDS